MDAKKIAIWVGVAAVIVVIGFLVLKPAAATGVIDVDAQKVQELMDDGVRVIDIRTPGEYEAGHIVGSELVPMNELPTESQAWDKTEPVIIYCATGSRSVEVVNYLAEQGFDTIYHYASGIVTWDGEVERGTASAVPVPPVEAPGVPVMYEFYTDS